MGDEIVNQCLAKQEKRRGFLLFRYFPPGPPSPSTKLEQAEKKSLAMEAQPSYVSLISTFPMDKNDKPVNKPSSITFTYGGIAIDTNSHALTADKTIIPGLLVAGADAGGFSHLGYAGGLALAFVTGYWAGREAIRQLGLPEPTLPAADTRDSMDFKAVL